MSNFIEYSDYLMENLAKSLEVELLKQDKKDKNCIEVINIVEFSLDNLLVKGKEEFLDWNLGYLKSLLLKLLGSISNNKREEFINFNFILIALKFIIKIIETLKEYSIYYFEKNESFGSAVFFLAEEENIQFELVLSKFWDFYTELIHVLNLVEHIEETETKLLRLYRLSSKIVVKSQLLIDPGNINGEKPVWLDAVTESLESKNPHNCLIACETIIDILNDRNPIYLKLSEIIKNNQVSF